MIDLDKDGKINPHIDSIKFSGDLVAGYSLGSTRVMRLSHETNMKEEPIDIILPPSMTLPIHSLTHSLTIYSLPPSLTRTHSLTLMNYCRITVPIVG